MRSFLRYLKYGFLGIISLGFIGAVVAVGCFFYILNYYGKDLPDYSQLRNYAPPIVTRLYAGDGNLLAEFAQEKRIFVPVEFIPDHVKQAFIAAEDKNFYDHSGVDVRAVARAVIKNVTNKLRGSDRRPEGASTITQQVAKNFFFSNEVNYERKLKEAILAYRMTKTLGKDHILELYLNQIYLGGGAHGIAAAALHYFDKSLDDLTIAEAAYLAALPKAPNNYHPVKHYEKALGRRNWVIGRLQADGYITAEQAEMAKLTPLKMKSSQIETVDAPYFAEEVRRELSDRYGEDSLYQGGLVVKTSVDPKLQAIAERVLRDGLTAYDKRHGWRGAVQRFETMDDWRLQLKAVQMPAAALNDWKIAVILDVDDRQATLGFVDHPQGKIYVNDSKWARKSLKKGYALGPEITKMSQIVEIGDVIMVSPKEQTAEDQLKEEDRASQDYILRQIPVIQGALIAIDPHTGRVLAMQGGWNYKYGGSEFNRATQAKRQPGSAFKPFVYLAALDKGFTPATLVLDSPFVLEDKVAGTWKPTNYSKEFYGPTPLRVGIEKSRNLMTVRLADFLGMDLIAKYSDHFGITESMRPLLANSLGSAETTLLKITTAYGMLVNGGKGITPTFIDRVQDRYGKTIFKHDKRLCDFCGHMVKWEGQNVPDILDVRQQIADPRTTYQMVSIMEGVVQRGTGTRLKSLNRPLAGKTGTTNDSRDAWFVGFSPDLVVGVYAGFDVPRSLGRKETGSSVAVPMFKDFMATALADEPVSPFRRPAGIKNIRVNAKTGARARTGDQHVIWESFVAGTEPTSEMYILGEDGISLLSGYTPGYGTYDNGYGTDIYNEYRYGNGQNGVSHTREQPAARTVPVPSSSATTGTGGVY